MVVTATGCIFAVWMKRFSLAGNEQIAFPSSSGSQCQSRKLFQIFSKYNRGQSHLFFFSLSSFIANFPHLMDIPLAQEFRPWEYFTQIPPAFVTKCAGGIGTPPFSINRVLNLPWGHVWGLPWEGPGSCSVGAPCASFSWSHLKGWES